MYCGSCLRDNALASELMAQGHDVILQPLYTPTRTDERNVSTDRVFFGGISIYLQQQAPLFRRTPKFLDWLWDRPSVIRFFSGRGVAVDPASLGALTVSMLEGRHGPHRKEVDRLAEWLRHEPAPDIVTLPYTLLIALARPLKEVTRRPVICTLQGEELFIDGLPEPWRGRTLELIRSQAADVDGFIAVSHYCARHMSRYLAIPEHKIHTVPLGINLSGYSPERRGSRSPRRIGFLGRIAPEKGLHLLVDAFRLVRAEPGLADCRLEAAGYMAPEQRGYFASVLETVKRYGLEDQFYYRGELSRDDKALFLRSLDVLSLPCVYDEPKGLPLLEAMACGVPVVQPRRGSFPEIVESTGGGILVEPDSAEALAEGLVRVLRDQALAIELGRSGYEAVRREYSIEISARRTLAVYKHVAGDIGAVAPIPSGSLA